MEDELMKKLRSFLVNPHGPEAADRIEAQAAQIAELVYWLEDAMNFHPEAHKRPVIEACIAKAKAVQPKLNLAGIHGQHENLGDF
jgi:hypothetical protein